MDEDRKKVREIEEKAKNILTKVFDPEIPVNIYDLGLVYEVKATTRGEVAVLMTLTSPNCPEAESLPPEIERRLKEDPEITDAKVIITFDPPWERSMMSEAARLELGMF
ncbi:MAG: iron-sulfur cluster assembly protein [Candidatus Kapaibacterium sp.]